MKKLISIIFALVPAMIFCEEITFTADFMSGTAGSKTDTTTLEGNATVQTSSMNISADAIELSGEDFRFITATGTVSGSITESQMDFTCGKLKYDRQTKVAQLEDAVHLVDVANEVTADAQIIEYNQNSETAVMQIEITLTQKDNVCTSAFAIYKKSEQKLEMSGNPKIQQGTDSFRAQEITLNLETQEITLDGRVKGTVSDSKPAKTETDTESAESETASQTENPPSESESSSQTENSPSDGENSAQNENSLSESENSAQTEKSPSESENSAQNENSSKTKNIQEDSQQTSEKNTKSASENATSAKS